MLFLEQARGRLTWS